MPVHLVDARALRQTLFVSVCIVMATFFELRLTTIYLDRLREIKTWNFAIRYSDTAAALFLVLQMFVVAVGFGVIQNRSKCRVLRKLLAPVSIKPVLWGAVVGVIVSVLLLPVVLLLDEHVQFIRLLLDNPISLQAVFLICLVGLVVPVTTEVVFRGILFDVLQVRTSAPIALIVNSLLFAYAWVIFDPVLGSALGLASAVLYRGFNSLVPGIICNGIVTLFVTFAMLFNLLFRR